MINGAGIGCTAFIGRTAGEHTEVSHLAAEKNTKLYEGIVAQLLERIYSGELQLGDRLPPERALAEEMGVSRTAIREALRAMEMMGCVESRVGEGTYLRSPRIADIVDPFSLLLAQNSQINRELLEVRLILETEVSALAARRRSDTHLNALRQTLADMEADILAGGIGLQADDAFHSTLI